MAADMEPLASVHEGHRVFTGCLLVPCNACAWGSGRAVAERRSCATFSGGKTYVEVSGPPARILSYWTQQVLETLFSALV